MDSQTPIPQRDVDSLLQEVIYELTRLSRGTKIIRDQIGYLECVLAENNALVTRLSSEIGICINRYDGQAGTIYTSQRVIF